MSTWSPLRLPLFRALWLSSVVSNIGSTMNDTAAVWTMTTMTTLDRVPVMVECLTDNVNRAASDMRVLFRKGQLGTSGSVAWDFDHLGMIEASPTSADADPELAAIEAGAQDFEASEEGATLFMTDPADLDAVCRALPAFGFSVNSAELGYRSKNPVSLSGAELEEVEAFLDALNNHDDVQNMYVGLAG